MVAYSIFGDSISTFRGMVPASNRWFYDLDDMNGTGVSKPEDTWWGQVIDRVGGRLVANASFSGSMVQGWGFPAGCSKARAAQIIGDDGECPDVVLVYMGINDYGWASPEAQAAGGSVASAANFDALGRAIDKPSDIDLPGASKDSRSRIPPKLYEGVDPCGMAKAHAIDDFRLAYVHMLRNLFDEAPNARIHCLTLSPARIEGRPGHFCYSLRGIDLDEYNDAIRDACKETGAICADVRAFGLDYSSIDGTHPNLKGMGQLADMYLASIEGSASLDEYERGMESVRDACADIEKDRAILIGKNSWGCYLLDE